jgi:long-subunit fatty acid transport protein
MKKIFLLSCVFLMSTNFYGQESNNDSSRKPFFGFKAGFNYFKQGSSEISYNNKYKGGFGYQLGTTLNIPMSKHSSFIPELLFQRISFGNEYFNEYSNGTTLEEIEYKVNVLFIPLNFKFDIINKVDLEFGPSIGLTLNNIKEITYTTDLNGIVKKSKYEEDIKGGIYVFGFNLGTNYNFNKNIYAGFRYSLLFNSYSNGNSVIKTGLFAVSAGYNFKK